MAIGVKEVTGSTGASASKASSVIVALEGTVHPAPLALFGESLSEYGFAPSKESEAPRVPNPLQSKRLTPMSLATRSGWSIINPSDPLTWICREALEISAPGANSSSQSAVAWLLRIGSAPTVALS